MSNKEYDSSNTISSERNFTRGLFVGLIAGSAALTGFGIWATTRVGERPTLGDNIAPTTTEHIISTSTTDPCVIELPNDVAISSNDDACFPEEGE